MPLTITPKSFYMIRHGESVDNERGVVSGASSDPELTAKGRQQAMAAREVFRLLDPKPGKIFVSGYEDGTTYKRTKDTAEILTGHTDFVVEHGIRERDFGAIDGKMPDDEYRKLKVLPEGTEHPDAHGQRVVGALNRRLAEEDAPPLFVGHGGTMRRVLEAMGMDKRVEVDNAQICQMVPVNGRWKIFELSAEKGKLKRTDITPPLAAAFGTVGG